MSSKKYSDAKNFRIALLDKLKQGGDAAQIQNRQRQVAFERFLCRLFQGDAPPWVLKGGHALVLRIQNSRATKDIDLALRDSKIFDAKAPEKQNLAILELLQEKAEIDLDDFFNFTVLPPTLDLDAPPYGGGRFPVECSVGGKKLIRFHIDIAIGDIWIDPHEKMELGNSLEFAGIKSGQIPIISVEQHFAEKIHAYTVPRKSGYNSRVKDLVDMLLLINEGHIDQSSLKSAVQKTFDKRKTHTIPTELLAPPKDWERPFDRMSRDSNLNLSIEESFEILDKFWSKISF